MILSRNVSNDSFLPAVIFFLAFVVVFPNSAQAKMYKWVDDQGKTHFTDSASKIPTKYRNQVKQPPRKKIHQQKLKDNGFGESEKQNSIQANATVVPEIKIPGIELPTEGLGKPTGKVFTSGFGVCGDRLEDYKREHFLKSTQKAMFCKEGTIAIPKTGWKCSSKKEKSMCKKTGVMVSCMPKFQCIEETTAYNRAKFGKLLDPKERKKIENENLKVEKERQEQEVRLEKAKKKSNKHDHLFTDIKKDDCKNFGNEIEQCVSYTCQVAHPMFEWFKIKKSIAKTSESNCRTLESMPNGGLMTCNFSKAQLKSIAKDYRTNSWGNLNKAMQDGTCVVTGYEN